MPRIAHRLPGCLALFVALGLAGCAVQQQSELPSFEVGSISLRPEGPQRIGADGRPQDDLLAVGGPWVRLDMPRRDAVLPATAATEAEPVDAHEAAIERLRQRSARPAPEARRLPPPMARSGAPRREAGRAPDRPPEVLAREHVLDWPTHIVARQITLYCPMSVAAEVRLTGDDVHQVHPTRRIARGGARLVCRELTLEAERITLRLLEDPDADLQIIARGGVRYAGRVRDQVFHEEGLVGLMITNDRTVPLR